MIFYVVLMNVNASHCCYSIFRQHSTPWIILYCSQDYVIDLELMRKLLNGYTHTSLIAVSSYVLGMDIHLDAMIYFTEFYKDPCWDRSYTYYILHPLQMLLKSIICLIIFTRTIRKSICPSSPPVRSSLLVRLGQK